MSTMIDLRGKHLLTLADLTPEEITYLIDLAAELKAAKAEGREEQKLAGKAIALIFEKDSTRTRCAFEVAAYDQGAHVTFIGPSGSHMSHKETVKDTARVLGRMYDAIEYRGFAQETAEELARWAGVPIYNGLTDEWHPTQMLADFLTMHESSHRPDNAITYTYMGDARSNIGRSLLVMGAIMGAAVRICGPRELWPPSDVQALAHERAERSGAQITLTDDRDEALSGTDFVYTDVWVSLGEPKDVWDERVGLLAAYRVNREALERTGNPRVKFMHCLPTFHDENTTVGREIMERTGTKDGLEVTDEVFQSPASIVFDQAENRLHTIKAVLVATIGGG
jgi:ornithine carbamoyltransferase